MVTKTLHAVARLYSPAIARTLVLALHAHENSLRQYIAWFSQTKTYRMAGQLESSDYGVVAMLVAAMAVQCAAGVWLLVDWVRHGVVGGWAFAGALLMSYPLVAALLLALGVALYRLGEYLLHPKRLGKSLVASILEMQVRQLRRAHRVTVVAVAGSLGKTSTKLAIARVLGQHVRVCYQEGNYNDRTTVPLVFFGQTQPSIWNIFAWMKIFGENAASLAQPYPYDVVVVELGTDGPGQMRQFAYLKPDITVLTAVAPEHMAFFGTLDAVAREELTVFSYSKQVLVNADNVAASYLTGREYRSYSLDAAGAATYRAEPSTSSLTGQDIRVVFPAGAVSARVCLIGTQGAKVVLAAAAVADMLGLSRVAIKQALVCLEPFPGRMQVLPGIKNTTLIDDTYNASPEAVTAALDALYKARAPQRIAILGSMNELGDYAREAHEIVGTYCAAAKLDTVVTVGVDARRWLAPAARAAGCQVRTFTSPYDAGRYVKKHLKPKAVVLAKGSQNGVFTEEALKLLLAHPADTAKLVRQAPTWLRLKNRQFPEQ